jgi:hypothetical protein
MRIAIVLKRINGDGFTAILGHFPVFGQAKFYAQAQVHGMGLHLKTVEVRFKRQLAMLDMVDNIGAGQDRHISA